MMLEHKVAVIYGAGGTIGGEVARAFAREGAHGFLAGRTLAKLDAMAKEITEAGGVAEAAQVDALDERSVEEHAGEISRKAGRIDISFNAINLDEVQDRPPIEMSPEDFTRPVTNAARTHFLTATAAPRRMANQGSGVILLLTASSARLAGPMMGGFGVACAAIEGLTRSLAGEVGPHGVRSCVCGRT